MLTKTRILGWIVLACIASSPAIAQSVPEPAVPNLTGNYYHELGNDRNPVPEDGWPPGLFGLGPIKALPGFKTNDQGPHHGDYTDPVLQPWLSDVIRQHNDAESAGKPMPQTSTLCLPDGSVKLLSRVGQTQILQTQDKVVILYQRDFQRRVVFLNQEHPKDLKPSWYGHSVGHYEGDTLVIDTIGFNDKTQTDRYGMPHTTALHTVERWRLFNDGKALEMRITVDDTGAFTRPWSGVSTSRRYDEPWDEYVCNDAEIRAVK